MDYTGTTADHNNPNSNNNPFIDPPYKAKQTTPFTTFKKIIYFLHFILIAVVTTHILIKYPHARELSFTLIALIIFGYMAIWTILINFLLLVINSFKKDNWEIKLGSYV